MKKNGFTLIEMLVVIGIVAALGIIMGISAHTITTNAQKKEFKSQMLELLNAATIYSELTDTTCTSFPCTVKIENLVSKGLIDKDIVQKSNPMYKTVVMFKMSDTLVVSKSNGKKEVTINCSSSSSYNLNLTNINDYQWEKC